MENMDDELQKYKEQLKAYRDELSKVYEKSNDIFEKQLSYISAGSLGITLIAIEKVVKDVSESQLKGLLITSWVLLICTLILNLLSHIFASRIHYKSMKDIDKENYNYDVTSKRNEKINYFNYASITMLILGIGCFIVYLSYNILL